jgi:hypothetical protein
VGWDAVFIGKFLMLAAVLGDNGKILKSRRPTGGFFTGEPPADVTFC